MVARNKNITIIEIYKKDLALFNVLKAKKNVQIPNARLRNGDFLGLIIRFYEKEGDKNAL